MIGREEVDATDGKIFKVSRGETKSTSGLRNSKWGWFRSASALNDEFFAKHNHRGWVGFGSPKSLLYVTCIQLSVAFFLVAVGFKALVGFRAERLANARTRKPHQCKHDRPETKAHATKNGTAAAQKPEEKTEENQEQQQNEETDEEEYPMEAIFLTDNRHFHIQLYQILHFLYYFMLGAIFPDAWLYIWLTGLAWECLEFWLGWCVWSDVAFNTAGLACGLALRSVIDRVAGRRCVRHAIAVYRPDADEDDESNSFGRFGAALGIGAACVAVAGSLALFAPSAAGAEKNDRLYMQRFRAPARTGPSFAGNSQATTF